MNILCSDKTGTVTTGEVIFKSAVDSCGNDSSFVRLLTQLNSHFQTGYKNPIDSAVEKESGEGFDFSGYKKIGEIPYNFVDKRLGIILSRGNETPFGGKDILISKGAFTNIVGESINLGDLKRIKSQKFTEVSATRDCVPWVLRGIMQMKGKKKKTTG